MLFVVDFFPPSGQHFGVLQAGTNGELGLGLALMQSYVPAPTEPGRS